MSSEQVIRLDGLCKSFGSNLAVDKLSLTVNRGEIFGLLGPDGAGKTTTIRMVVGIMQPSGGDGEVLGFNINKQAELLKPHIGYMSQRFSLDADLTVAENLEYFGEIYEIPKSERAAREKLMYEFSRLEPFKHRLAGDLSGGMKQKLALACTLMHTPSLLILDEPTTGVDPVSRRDFWRILYQLVADGMTILVSTPYMDEAERCNRIALMDQGRLLHLDTPDAMKAGMRGQLFQLESGQLTEAQQRLLEHPEVLNVQLFGDRLHVQCSANIHAEQIEHICAGLGAVVSSIPFGLEDVFVNTIADAHHTAPHQIEHPS